MNITSDHHFCFTVLSVLMGTEDVIHNELTVRRRSTRKPNPCSDFMTLSGSHSLRGCSRYTSVMWSYFDHFDSLNHKYLNRVSNGECRSHFFQLVNYQGSISPNCFSGRVVHGFWWTAVMVISATYTANLAAFLTVARLDSGKF